MYAVGDAERESFIHRRHTLIITAHILANDRDLFNSLSSLFNPATPRTDTGTGL
jgi:hypothetical protein